MAIPVLKDFVLETSTTVGTGSYTLAGAATGFRSLSGVVSSGSIVYFAADDGVDREVGYGTYLESGGTRTISRTVIFASTQSGSKINWGTGTRNVYLVIPADKVVIYDTNGEAVIQTILVQKATYNDLKWVHGGSGIYGLYDDTLSEWAGYWDPDNGGGPRFRVPQLLVADDLSADTITLDGAAITTAATTALASALTGTAQAGAASTITLATGASAVDDAYNYMTITLTGGTGSGQARLAIDYVGSTKVLTVSPAWSVNPDNSTTYSFVQSSANEGKIPVVRSDGTLSADYVPLMVGATAGAPGSRGLATPPLLGEQKEFLRGDNTWASIGVTYTESWRTTWSDNATYTQSHGLGSYPDEYWMEAECTSTDLGYDVGQRIRFVNGQNVSVVASDTQLKLRVKNGGIEVPNMTSTGLGTMAVAKWKLRLRAIRWQWEV